MEPLDLAAAIDRAFESNNQEFSAYLSLMIFDDAPYCEILTHRRAWTVLATHYSNSGKLDKAEEVIRRAQDPASEVTIDFFDLGALIRLHLGEDEYVRWFYDETRTGNPSAAHALTCHPCVSYDDAVTAINNAGFHILTSQQLRFSAATYHHKTDDALATLRRGDAVVSYEEIISFAEQQAARTHPVECVYLVGGIIRTILPTNSSTTATYLSRLRTMVAASPEVLTSFYELLTEVTRTADTSPSFQRHLAERGLIPRGQV